MHKLLALSVLAALAFAGSYALPAKAADSVTVNGTTYTCTNSCVVTTSGGTTTIRDCCGGRVGFTIRRIEE